uniref:Uncharacterized protein n=1 Tax=Rhizophora mucronata TaxID=61149 RepID=A0A2P2MAF0_RHIMU
MLLAKKFQLQPMPSQSL